jgi:hypothetical protein
MTMLPPRLALLRQCTPSNSPGVVYDLRWISPRKDNHRWLHTRD